MCTQQPPKTGTPGPFIPRRVDVVMHHSEVGRRCRNTAWARSQPHYPWGLTVVLQPSPWSVFSDCLNIFTVITSTFTFQAQVSAFYSASHLCFSPLHIWRTLRLEEPLHTRRRSGAGRQLRFAAGWKPKLKSARTL